MHPKAAVICALSLIYPIIIRRWVKQQSDSSSRNQTPAPSAPDLLHKK